MASQLPEFTQAQYAALQSQIASGVQRVRYDGRGEVQYLEPKAAIELLDRMRRVLEHNQDAPPKTLTRRTYYRRP